MNLWRLILRRLVLIAITLVGVSLIIFGVTQVLPGDVAEMLAGQMGTEETVNLLREKLGLNRPLYIQYLDWFWGFLTLDPGNSLSFDQPIMKLAAPLAFTTTFSTRGTGLPVTSREVASNGTARRELSSAA